MGFGGIRLEYAQIEKMKDHYEISLKILYQLLHQSGNNHWANWIKKDIKLWKLEKSVKHHLGAYGGMGSINDLWVGGENKDGIWENLIFETIKNLSWNLAKKRIKEAPKSVEFYKNGNGQLTGWRCINCGISKISKTKIEYYLSNKYLPAKIVQLVKDKNLEDLLPVKNWIHNSEIEVERAKILQSISETDIELEEFSFWLKICPNCKSGNVCVYRWEYEIINDRIIESKDNLKIKGSQHKTMYKTAVTFIRRLLRLQ